MGKFTNKRKKELLKNKYILTFSKNHIIYTEEFRKKVVLELSLGKNILQIFTESGFNVNEIGLSSIKANKYNWLKEFKIENINGTRVVTRIKGAYPVLKDDGKIQYITVTNGKLVKEYTNEEISLLSKNKYVEYVDKNRITFTREFKILFMEEYKKGKVSFMIFSENGLDPILVDKKRIKTWTKRWKKQYEKDPTFSNIITVRTLTKEEKEKKLNDIKKLKKRINQLEMENEFLKKVSALRKG